MFSKHRYWTGFTAVYWTLEFFDILRHFLLEEITICSKVKIIFCLKQAFLLRAWAIYVGILHEFWVFPNYVEVFFDLRFWGE